MGSDFDEGSFKKARSFLLVLSSLLLVLWYFDAEMSTLSILGNSIKFTANTHNLWVVLAGANAYFFFRFVQQLPPDWREPGKHIEDIYERVLINTSRLLYRRENIRSAMEHFHSDPEHKTSKNIRVHPEGHMHHHVSRDAAGGLNGNPPLGWVHFTLRCTYLAQNGNICSVDGYHNTVKPHRMVIRYSRFIAFIKGVFLAPWFSENVFPMLYALAAIGVATWQWWQINHVVS